ncbi:MAG: tRNA lysidine(34) synthetase TilS [Anaerolineales bacterium]|nr:tRNA lysidine(34) synthetase TilS [Anaerolineales bacterium]
MNHLPAPPASDPLLAAITALLDDPMLLPPARPLALVVGVSGGADSVCLLHLLHAVAPELGLTLHVAHVDHGLRAESPSDAHFVRELAASLDLPFHLVTLAPASLRTAHAGIEAAAREARYGALCAIARNVAFPGQVPCLAVAHHRNDQAETVLLRLIQGTGVGGLGAMQPATMVSYTQQPAESLVRLIRPLLQASRTDLVAYLERQDLHWCCDASNEDRHFLRNRIRHEVLPLLEEMNPAIVAALGRTAALARAASDRLERHDAELLAHLTTEAITEERVVLDLERWRGLPEPDRQGVLYAALRRLVPDGRELGVVHIEQLMRVASKTTRARGPHPLPCQLAWTIAGAPWRLCLHQSDALPVAVAHPWLDGVWRQDVGALSVPLQGVVPNGDWYLLISRISGAAAIQTAVFDTNPWHVLMDADRIGPLQLTTPQPGMKFTPVGMDGKHKHVGDLFTDAKILPALRIGWPLIVDDSTRRVLWVCGIRAAADGCVTPATRHAVWLQWTPATGDH